MSMALIAEALIFGLVLSMDSFSAALAMGFRPFQRKDALRFALASGTAETLSAFAGAIAGSYIFQNFSAYDHWVAFFLLLFVALHMAMEGLRGLKVQQATSSNGCSLGNGKFYSFNRVLLVSFVTSLDALGIGMSLGISSKPLVPFLASIGIWAAISTILGMLLARRLSKTFGPAMTLVGAGILLLMSFQLLKI